MKVLIWLSIGLDRRTPSFHLIREIVDQLIKKKCDITIIQKNSGGRFDYSVLKNECVHFVNVSCKNPNKRNLFSRYFTDLLYVLKCRRILKKNHNYESVFVQSSNVAGFQTSIIRKYNKNCNLVYNVQDLFPNNLFYLKKIKKNSIIYKVISHFQYKAYLNSNTIITISEDIKEELMEMGVEENKIKVIYNWSYQDSVYDFIDNNETVDRIFKDGFFNVVYAGNIGVMQNVDIILEAANILNKKNHNIQFIIIGDGIYKQKLIDIKEKLNLNNVIFYDMMPSEFAPTIYQHADINVIPLKKDIYRTALPSKTATCLACQRPIIFCLGSNSVFGQKINAETKCPCIDSDNAEILAETILKIKNEQIKVSTKSCFEKSFSKTRNGKLYSNIITGHFDS